MQQLYVHFTSQTHCLVFVLTDGYINRISHPFLLGLLISFGGLLDISFTSSSWTSFLDTMLFLMLIDSISAFYNGLWFTLLNSSFSFTRHLKNIQQCSSQLDMINECNKISCNRWVNRSWP